MRWFLKWFRLKGQKKGTYVQEEEEEEKPWDIVEEVTNDPHLGKRVFCLSLLPRFEAYGTIQRIIRYSNKNDHPSQAVEEWRVRNDHGINIETTREAFELYEHDTEFKSGDRVRHYLDNDGYLEGMILRPIVVIDHVRFVVRIEKVQAHLKIAIGQEQAYPPGRLVKL